jgi:hypothetical protein
MVIHEALLLACQEQFEGEVTFTVFVPLAAPMDWEVGKME